LLHLGAYVIHTGFWWGHLKGKSPVARPRHRWENNIKMDVNEMGWEGMDRIGTSADSCSLVCG